MNVVKITKTRRIQDMVLGSTAPISKTEIYTGLSGDVAITTIEVVLGEMVREGAVKKCGSGRNTRYVKKH